jgi:lysyl-tRNA synthetase (EC 6.1.1.6)
MSKEKIIGKGTWIDKLASELIEREKKLGRNLDLIRVESGLGASGIPHIGSLGDAVRAYGVKLSIGEYGIQIRINCIFR